MLEIDLMNTKELQKEIEKAWEDKDSISQETNGIIREAVDETLSLLDQGKIRVVNKIDSKWVVNEWCKKSVLLSFRLNSMYLQKGGPDGSLWWDKVPSKFSNWGEREFKNSGFRTVPSSVVRYSAYIAKDVILMPSFVNLGAFVDEGSMVDTWSTVGSCAQIGKNVHLSGGVGIGGVLEPLQASPVIIEDNCFIGARSEIAEGVIVEEGAVISMGVYIGSSTKIINRDTGEIYFGRVPAYSVVVPGSIPGKKLDNGMAGPSLYCAVIVKQVDAKTRSKVSINELLRE